jgi:hypothetical protein
VAGLTSPMAAATQLGALGRGVGVAATVPTAAGLGAAAVASGVASQFWIELLAYPPGSARSLWLQVGGVWKRYDNSPAHWEDMVQRAFASGQTVQVWYDGEIIVGLVVNS